MSYKNLEDALRNWQNKFAYYEYELSITASATQKFELKERIKECQEQINRLKQEISRIYNPKIPIPIIDPTLPRRILYPDLPAAIPQPESVFQQKSLSTPVSSPQYQSDKVAPFPQGRVDYAPLNDLLAAENWKEADQETMRIMLEIADREESGWLQKEHIQKLSDETLDTINKLWIYHSKGQFGFSVQAKIWLECKGEPGKFNYTIYQDKFCIRTGWRVNKNWLKRYDDFQFYLHAQKGHFPSLSFPDIKDQGISWKNWKETFENLLPRFFTCLSII